MTTTKRKITLIKNNGMKELSINEKAKRYDEAIKVARQYYNDKVMPIGTNFKLETIFPELKESDDETVRKALINVFASHKDYESFYGVYAKDILAWLEKQGKIVEYYEDKLDRCACSNFNKGYKEALEKQGEQNLANSAKTCKDEQNHAWSEEDEIRLKHILRLLDVKDDKMYLLMFGLNSLQDLKKDKAWLRYLKDRIKPQPKQEWNEENENNILFLTSIIEQCFKDKETITLYGDNACANFTKEGVIDRLKSLTPQNTWKPSDEQIKALDIAIRCGIQLESWEETSLKDLMEQLKKLK